SKNPAKVKRLLQNFEHEKQKMVELDERDHIRNSQPPVYGIEIMKAFGIAQGKEVGLIKSAIKEAILEGKVANEHDAAYEFMIVTGASLGLKPVE
ncbi:MAG: tRNA nucleotidyltransferase, partial [Paramuribaculum sp.]|nr:tRNA nucleotidyltransferase [Paramuribaculum sp.]